MSVSQTAVHGPSESEVNSLRVGNASVQERQARQPPTVVRCISLSLGVMTAKDAFCTKWTVSEKVTFVIDYGFRRITLHFGYCGDDYKLVFKFGALQGRRLLVHSASDNEGVFTMPLKEPAEFWMVTDRAQHQAAMGWTRITSLPVTESRMLAPFTEITWRRKAHMQISGEPDAIQIGSWTVYQVKLDLRRVRKRYQEVIRRAALYKLTPKPGKGSSTHAQQQQYIRSTTTSPSIFDRQKREEAITDFDQLYALESAISRRILCEDNLSQAFINLYRSLEPSAACEAIKLMGRERVWEPEAQLKKMASARGRLELKPRKRPPYVVFIRRILVTPTTMELELPQAESTNRITRHYKQHLDRFLRVQFVDEGGRPIHTSTLPKHHVHPIYNRIACVLQNGIQIGSRQYDFLAFSSSQLRAHSCWFFASTEDLNAEMIRSWMGDFSYERIVAKYAARMGQCFSTTHPIIKLEKQEVTMIHDIVRDKYTFSDGVGLVSRNMANTVARKMGIKGRTPSAYQIRLGGAKGVLTVSHQDLPDKASIALRPSQIKFQSNHRTLEVIQFAKYSPLRLNCQIILLLSTLGVSDEVFLDLLEKTIAMYEPITTNPTKASQILRRHIDDYGINASMARIVEAGFLVRKDPYIINLLNMFRISKLKEVKKRAKLDVFNKGAHLLGVLDETDSLEENQIFCQLSDAHRFHGSTSARQIIKGKCIVYRSPSLHPGDIRTVEAVDCPALHHLENVVVFSAKGSRSLPNMCSGGDLDGDQYSIIWDPKLFPSCELENQKPMDFDTPIAARVSQVCVRHLQSFFVKAIINDNLGIIANAHMARADASDKNAFDGDCLELARRHSIAVDFPKTGIPASMPARLRVSKYPDFMEKKDKVTYESGKILGQLYRAIDKGVYRGYREQLENPTQFDPLLWTEGMVQHIAAARRLKRLYEREIQGLMANFGIPTEAELLSGSIIQWMQKERHQKYFEVRDEARKAVVRLRESWYKKEFPQNKNNKELEAKAAAWYYVTYHPTEQRSRKRRGHNHQRRKDIKYISFPWVAQDILCRIMRKNWKREILPQHSQAFSEEEIRKYKSTGLQDEEDDSSDTDDLDDMLYTASSSSSDEE